MKINDKTIIQVAMQVGLLKHVKRHGWILKGIRNSESVAEHSFRVTFLTMLLHENRRLNKEKIMNMALLHDLGTALIGDIVYEQGRNIVAAFKYKHKDERNAFKEMFKDVEGKEKYLSLWDEFIAQTTPEAKFVKQVEKLEMVLQALEYEQQGYEPVLFDEFWENASLYIKNSELEPLYRELQEERLKKTQYDR
ncbi:HD domain-containing protein [Candidatus Roizmanbacteria bacterium]|nr:HD domain-containing protein [Candidatus Roizmanbacteria bacterium]